MRRRYGNFDDDPRFDRPDPPMRKCKCGTRFIDDPWNGMGRFQCEHCEALEDDAEWESDHGVPAGHDEDDR